MATPPPTNGTRAPTPSPVKPCNLCTFSQGGYGTKCSGKPPGTCQQLVANWKSTQPGCLLEACFNGSITLGNASNGGKTVTFTSAAAIEKFLPASGPPSIFKVSAVNPTSTTAGVFAGQLLTAMLNIQFSGVNPSMIYFNHECFHVNSVLQGLSLAQVIYIANQVIAGLPGYSQYTPTILNDALTLFNNAFDGCQLSNTNCSCFTCQDRMFLFCPILSRRERNNIRLSLSDDTLYFSSIYFCSTYCPTRDM
jgi:hypothetical protein